MPRAGAAAALAGAAFSLLGAGLLLLPSARGSEIELSRVGGNGPLNESAADPRAPVAHNSPSLARNPRDPRHLVSVNRLDLPSFSCAIHVSRDGGRTWDAAELPQPRGEEPKCFAPDVAFAADGTVVVSYVTLAGNGNVPHAVWLTRSPDGGRTLSAPERLLGELAFQARLAADPEDGRRLYLTWLQAEEVGLLRFATPGNPIRAMRSDDGGATWSAPATVSSPAHARALAGTPVAARDGRLFVLYLDLGDDRLDYDGAHEGQGGPAYPGAWSLVLASSRDGGGSWRHRVLDARLRPVERTIVFTAPFPSLAVSPDGRRLFAAFHDARLGDADVWLWASQDGGDAWSAPLRVNDTARRDGSAQYLPQLDLSPDGRLDVVYYDRRSDPEDRRNEVSLQSSAGGKEFTGRLRLSDRSFASDVGLGSERGLADLGSRLALSSADATAVAIWPDTRGGTPATGKQDLAAAIVDVRSAQRLAGRSALAARIAGGLLVLGGVALLAMALGRRRAKPAAATA